jgi:hypothetical protein
LGHGADEVGAEGGHWGLGIAECGMRNADWGVRE